MNIGIVGRGVVGNALGLALSDGHKFSSQVHDGLGVAYGVVYHDVDPAKSTISLKDLLHSSLDLIFICLPTPQVKGSLLCDTSILDEFFLSAWVQANRSNNFVIKSTVP